MSKKARGKNGGSFIMYTNRQTEPLTRSGARYSRKARRYARLRLTSKLDGFFAAYANLQRSP